MSVLVRSPARLLTLVVLLGACGGATPAPAGPTTDTPPPSTGEGAAASRVELSFAPQVIVGTDFGCWLKADHSVTCWGSLEKSAPAEKFRQIAAASFHACGVRDDGTAQCWGGQNAAPSGEFAQVAAGDVASCGVRPDGVLVCWGAKGNTEYPAELIEKCSANDELLECEGLSWLGVRIVTKKPRGKFKRVAVGGRHVCALTMNGEPKCWAPAESDQDEADGQEVDDIALPPGKYREVTAGFLHTCGIRDAGGDVGPVVCVGGVEGQSEPSARASTARRVAAGVLTTCALLSDGGVECWGGEDGKATSAPAGKFVSVAAGLRVACGLADSGPPQCWGEAKSPAAQVAR